MVTRAPSSTPALRLHSMHIQPGCTNPLQFSPLPRATIEVLPLSKAALKSAVEWSGSNSNPASSKDSAEQEPRQTVDVRVVGPWLTFHPQKGSVALVDRAPLMLMETRLGVEKGTGDLLLVVAAANVAKQAWFLILKGNDPEDGKRALLAMGRGGAVRSDFAETYFMSPQPFGVGSNAKVYNGLLKACDGGLAAVPDVVVKIPWVNGVSGGLIPKDVKQEVTVLAVVQGHPNVVKFHGLFHGPEAWQDRSGKETRSWAIVLDRCCGGDAFDFATKSVVSEAAARLIVQGIISALAFVHSRRIVHRDIKPENILLKRHGMQPVLADFGLACSLFNRAEMRRQCGSPGFAAPEILTGKPYGEKVDLFGAGASLFFLLSMKVPFGGSTQSETLRNTVEGSVDWCQSKRLHRVSSSCKEFMLTLLVKDPDARPLAVDALSHPWMATAATVTLTEPQLASACSIDKRRFMKRQGASQLPTEGDSAADARLANLGSCLQTQVSMQASANGEFEACEPARECGQSECHVVTTSTIESISRLQSHDSSSHSSFSGESSQDEGGKELSNKTLTVLPFQAPARPDKSDAAPQRSKRPASMGWAGLLINGRVVSRVMCSGTPRAGMRHCVLADSETQHGDAVNRSSVSARSNRVARTRKPLARHSGEARTEDLPALDVTGSGTWSLFAAGGKGASSAGEGGTLDAEESGPPDSARTKPRQIPSNAVGMAKPEEELTAFQREQSRQTRWSRHRHALTPLACKASDSLQQVELTYTGRSQSKNTAIPGYSVHGAVGDSKTVEELPTFAQKARRSHGQKTRVTKV